MPVSDRVGRRIKLHDLHVLLAVVEAGSMGKAAGRLNTTQPAVSRSVAELEHTLGVRLLDRGSDGVAPTQYGRALIGSSLAAFDELRQGVKNIEFLADPTIGEIRIGGNDAIIAGLLPTVFTRLRSHYPGIAIHVMQLAAVQQQYRELRERRIDLVLGRIAQPIEEDFSTEILFYERSFVVAGPKNRWLRRRKIELAELANEPWTLPTPDTLIGSLVANAFRASGLEFPRRAVATGSIHLHMALIASGPFLAILPGSMLRFAPNRAALKVLPVELPIPPWPTGIVRLKNRTVSPAAKLFIECAREVGKPLAKLRPRI
jgi:DNA-binding transcriptional LysR family regulator